MTLQIVSQLDHATYTIGYANGVPIAIVEESDGGYFAAVEDGQYLHDTISQRYWYLEDGRWYDCHADSDLLIDVMAGRSECDINDGSQTPYDGDIEDYFL